MVSARPLLPQNVPISASMTSPSSILHQDEEFSEKDDSTDGTDVDMSPLSSSPRQKFSTFTEYETANMAFLDGEEREALRKCKRKLRSKRLRKQAWPKEIQENNKLVKYWYKRYRLFSKFDQGIKLDQGKFIKNKNVNLILKYAYVNYIKFYFNRKLVFRNT